MVLACGCKCLLVNNAKNSEGMALAVVLGPFVRSCGCVGVGLCLEAQVEAYG